MEDKKSTHKVEIVPIRLEPHPNADTLSIAKVYGYNIVVKTDEWKDINIAAFIPPDSVVPDTEQFAFLGDKKRITVKKFRGVFSQGLLIPAPEGSKLGDDISDILGITRYVPNEQTEMSGDMEIPPFGFRPKYDVEDWHKYRDIFIHGEGVIVTEKIHGTNGRFTYQDNQMYCGSRSNWWKKSEKNIWWKCLEQHPWIEGLCKLNESLTIYGEVYGNVQELKYGAEKNQLFFAMFDIWNTKTGTWIEEDDASIMYSTDIITQCKWVPIIYTGAYSHEKMVELSRGQSVINNAKHIREGIVIKPIVPRRDPEIGLVKLKLVNDEYLEKVK